MKAQFTLGHNFVQRYISAETRVKSVGGQQGIREKVLYMALIR